MRLRTVLLVLAGSLAVNLGVSCASQVSEFAQGHDAGTDSVVSHDTATTHDTSSPADTLIDVVADVLADTIADTFAPPKDADAEPAGGGWTKETANCANTAPDGGLPIWYAEVAVPGRSKIDLVRSSVMLCASGAEWCGAGSVQVGEGKLRVRCTEEGLVATFVIPPTL